MDVHTKPNKRFLVTGVVALIGDDDKYNGSESCRERIKPSLFFALILFDFLDKCSPVVAIKC